MPIWYPGFYNGEDVWINDIPLNSYDETGCKWLLTDIDGWWGLPEPEVPEDTRPFSEDGSYITAGRYQSRVITVTGHIVPSDGNVRAVTNARNSLNRVLNMVRQTGILRVDEPDNPKQARVQIVGRPLSKFNSINGDLEFNIQFRAADPRKYSLFSTVQDTGLPAAVAGRTYNKTYNYMYAQSLSSGVINAYNSGSYNTYGTLEISGPVSNPSIEHFESGSILKFNIVLNIGDTLQIDLQRKTVILNSGASRRSTLIGTSKWFTLQPGDNTLLFRGVQQVPAQESNPARINLILNPAIRTSALGYSVTTVDGDSVVYGEGTYGTGIYGGSGGEFLTSASYMSGMGAIDTGFYRVQYVTVSAGGTSDVGFATTPVTEGEIYTGSMYARASADIDGAQAGIIWMGGPGSTQRINQASTPRPVVGATRWGHVAGTDETVLTTIEDGLADGPDGSTGFQRSTVLTSKTSGESGPVYLEDTSLPHGDIGDTITSSIYVRFSQTVTVKPRITLLDGGVEVDSTDGTSVSVPANTWRRVSVVNTASADYDAARVAVVLDSSNVIDVDGTYDVSQLLIESGSTLRYYFDGSTADAGAVDYSWSGATNDSTSVAVTAVASQVLGTSLGSLTETPANEWVRLSVSDVAPVGTLNARLVTHLEGYNLSNATYLDVDNFLFEEQDQIYAYFDGNSPGASWSGLTDNSTSSTPAIVGVPESMLKLTYHSAWIE